VCNVGVLWLNAYTYWAGFWNEGYHREQFICIAGPGSVHGTAEEEISPSPEVEC